VLLVLGDELPQAIVRALDLVEGAKTTSPVLFSFRPTPDSFLFAEFRLQFFPIFPIVDDPTPGQQNRR
jgi:hypothetical protein